MAYTFKISFNPDIIGINLLKPSPAALFPLTSNRVTYCYSGAQAIYRGAHILGLQKGDCVLVPAYSCGSEIAPLLEAGLTLKYYRSLTDLSPDIDHLVHLCRNKPKALFIIHYFGFPQPMRVLVDFKKRYNLHLIEDNAHGLYSTNRSGVPLGSMGDIAIFSFTKSLPATDGGALVLNCPEETGLTKGRISPSLFSVARKGTGKTASQLIKAIGMRSKWAGYQLKTQILDRLSAEPNLDSLNESGWDTDEQIDHYLAFDPEQAGWGMSKIARFIVAHQTHRLIRAVRRRNFSLLLESFPKNNTKLKPLFSNLTKGACPLLFPVLSEDSLSLYHFLRSGGVEALRFWRFFHFDHPRNKFPFETALKKNVVAIPIHQDLRIDDVLYMAELLREWEPAQQRTACIQ